MYGVSESAKPQGTYKLLRITDIQDNQVNWDIVPFTNLDTKKAMPYILKDGDILFARTGATVGKSYIVKNLNDNAIYASYLIRVQLYKHILPQYIKYFFESGYYWRQIQDNSVGTGQPNVNGSLLAQLRLPLPPLAEQRHIVAEIERWFALIDELDANKQDLQVAIRQVRAKVLDLAIHGKLVPQDPNDEPAIALLRRITPHFTPSDTSHYQNVPFDIPASWEWVRLGEIGKWQAGGTPNRSHKEYYGGDIPWLKTGDLNDGYITDIPENITQLGLDCSSAKLNPKGSVLVALYGATIGKVGILTYPATTNQACCACIDYPAVETLYLFYFLRSHRDIFISQGGGGAQPNISKEIITNTLLPLPPLAEQKRIVSEIERIFGVLGTIEENIR